MAQPAPTPSVSGDAFSAAVRAITAAFGDPTRRAIFLFAREAADRGVTAAQVAERFEVHPNVARHHLEKLAAGGYLEVHVERAEHATAGRPSKRYRAAADDGALPFPDRRDDLGKVSVVGAGMKSHPGIAAKTFATLDRLGIEPQVVSTSPIKIACYIQAADVEEAVRALHSAFDLEAAHA